MIGKGNDGMKIIEVVKAINKYRLTFKNWNNIIYYIKIKKLI